MSLMSPMSRWHARWQEAFPEDFRERKFQSGRRVRYADVFADNSRTVLELQHSHITQKEVEERTNDYLGGFGCRRLIWLIDGRIARIHLLHLSRSILLVMDGDRRWMHEAFTGSTDFVYITVSIVDSSDTTEGAGKHLRVVVRFRPSDVKSHMVEARLSGVSFAAFRDAVRVDGDVDRLFSMANDVLPPVQCKLYLNQRGAGCGKTYESVKMALDVAWACASRAPMSPGSMCHPRFGEKRCFVYLTKQHTAKNVILDEFRNQTTPMGGEGGGKEEGKLAMNVRQEGKQWRADFDLPDNVKGCGCGVEVIIGTIDSFFYAVGNKRDADKLPGDYFANLRATVLGGHRAYDDDGRIRYGGDDLRLNRRCLLILDEAQDLPSEYIETLACIQRGTNADMFVIGDKLQSIWGSDNVFSMLQAGGLPSANVVFDVGENVVRRFRRERLMHEVNRLIRYADFDLPEIQAIGSLSSPKHQHQASADPVGHGMEAVVWFPQPDFREKGITNAKRKKFVSAIVDAVDEECRAYGGKLLPHNFMFIFPIMKNNVLSTYLESALHEYWSGRFMHDSKLRGEVLARHSEYWKARLTSYDPQFYRHAVLHISDVNRPINLDESAWATRLTSIHASKGQGREVVFFLNASESELKIFSGGRRDLQYESLLHVAVTRQKLKLYVGVTAKTGKADDVRDRLSSGTPLAQRGLIDANDDSGEGRGQIRSPKIGVTDVCRHLEYRPEHMRQILDEHLSDVFENLAEVRERNRRKRWSSFDGDPTPSTAIIDWGHHVIRGVVMRHSFMRSVARDATMTLAATAASAEGKEQGQEGGRGEGNDAIESTRTKTHIEDVRHYKQIMARMLSMAKRKPVSMDVTEYYRQLKLISDENSNFVSRFGRNARATGSTGGPEEDDDEGMLALRDQGGPSTSTNAGWNDGRGHGRGNPRCRDSSGASGVLPVLVLPCHSRHLSPVASASVDDTNDADADVDANVTRMSGCIKEDAEQRKQKKYDALRVYSRALCDIIRGIQDRILSDADGSCMPGDMCPVESLVLEHFLQVTDRGHFADITAMKVYELLNALHCDTDTLHRSPHVSDNVRKALMSLDRPSQALAAMTSATTEAIRQSLIVHYSALRLMHIDMYANFVRHLRNTLGDATPVTYNVDHLLTFEGSGGYDFKSWARVPFVATTERTVVLVYLHPTFDHLNQREICTEALLSTFLARNPPEGSNNHIRFTRSGGGRRRADGKDVHVCIMSFALTEPLWMRLCGAETETSCVRDGIRSAMAARMEATNLACLQTFERHMKSKDLTAIEAIERTRKELCINGDGTSPRSNVPLYVRDFLNRAEEQSEQGDGVLTLADMEQFVEERLKRWLSLPAS